MRWKITKEMERKKDEKSDKISRMKEKKKNI